MIIFFPIFGNPVEKLVNVVPPLIDFNTCPDAPCVVKYTVLLSDE